MVDKEIKPNVKNIILKEYCEKDGNQEYRYYLSRSLDNADKVVTVIMCNPSKASFIYEDKTVMNVNNYFTREGYNKINIVNLFAYKNKEVSELKKTNEEYENKNIRYIEGAVEEASLIVVAWGYGKENLKNWKTKELKELSSNKINEVKHLLKDSNKLVQCFTNGKKKNLHPRDLNEETWKLTNYFEEDDNKKS
jgi:hypothetical protein